MLCTAARFSILGTLYCAVAFSVTAAPAPVYKHRPGDVWLDGWNDPVAKRGGCRFARNGKKLTIIAPGSGLDSAHLFREVEGDFVLEVRVNGDFRSTQGMGHRKAGIVLTFGRTRVKMDRQTEMGWGTVSGGFGCEWTGTGRDGSTSNAYCFQDANSISHLRVSRKGDKLILEAREDQGEWEARNYNCPALTLPKKIKVGVCVEASAPGPFGVQFDQLRLAKGSE